MNPDFERAFDRGVAKISGWMEGFVQNLPNLIAAALILLVFWAGARVLRRGARLGLRHLSRHRGLNDLLANLVYVAVITVGVFVALGILRLDRTVTTLLAGAGILGLALGFAFKDTAENFISGVLLTLRRPFEDGDIIETSDYLGTVLRINMRATEIRTFQGQKVIVPNRMVFQNAIINFSDQGVRRIDLPVGVAYGSDLEKVRRVAVDTIRSLDLSLPDHEIEFFFEGFGDSSIDFEVRFWIAFRRWNDFLAARSEAVIAIKKAFDAAGITIPFPIRTLDFSPVGGVTLREEIPFDGPFARGRTDR